MEFTDISICGITLSSTTYWQFVPSENFILARHDHQKGVLRITLVEATSEIPTTDHLFDTGEALVSDQALPTPFEVRLPDFSRKTHLFGAASYHLKNKKSDFFTRFWFLHRDAQTAYGIYGCRWEERSQEDTEREIYECERMMMSVRFK